MSMQDFMDKAASIAKDVSRKVKEKTPVVIDGAKKCTKKVASVAKDVAGKAKEKAPDAMEKAKEVTGSAVETVKEKAPVAMDKAKEVSGELKDIATGEGSMSDKAKAAAKAVTDHGDDPDPPAEQ